VVDFIDYWCSRTGVVAKRLCGWLDVSPCKICAWRKRRGASNRHGCNLPHANWLLPWERQAIIDFYLEHEDEGYRRRAYMMVDQDIACVPPSTVYKVLKKAGVLRRKGGKKSRKGSGFDQPDAPHQHWHIDITYVHIAGRHTYLTTVIDGYSRYIVASVLREHMTNADVDLCIQQAHERFPNAHPRIISDNGKQFMSRDFKELLGIHGFSHVRTSPFYPQSNGKIERWHKSVKGECISSKYFGTLEQAAEVIQGYIDYYNMERLHSAIGYVTPYDMLCGRKDQIVAEREAKLDAARRTGWDRWQDENRQIG